MKSIVAASVLAAVSAQDSTNVDVAATFDPPSESAGTLGEGQLDVGVGDNAWKCDLDTAAHQQNAWMSHNPNAGVGIMKASHCQSVCDQDFFCAAFVYFAAGNKNVTHSNPAGLMPGSCWRLSNQPWPDASTIPGFITCWKPGATKGEALTTPKPAVVLVERTIEAPDSIKDLAGTVTGTDAVDPDTGKPVAVVAPVVEVKTPATPAPPATPEPPAAPATVAPVETPAPPAVPAAPATVAPPASVAPPATAAPPAADKEVTDDTDVEVKDVPAPTTIKVETPTVPSPSTSAAVVTAADDSEDSGGGFPWMWVLAIGGVAVVGAIIAAVSCGAFGKESKPKKKKQTKRAVKPQEQERETQPLMAEPPAVEPVAAAPVAAFPVATQSMPMAQYSYAGGQSAIMAPAAASTSLPVQYSQVMAAPVTTQQYGGYSAQMAPPVVYSANPTPVGSYVYR